jgi:hypothetical protein
MMSASSDNRIVIYSIAGQVLHTLDTKQNEIYSAAIRCDIMSKLCERL